MQGRSSYNLAYHKGFPLEQIRAENRCQKAVQRLILTHANRYKQISKQGIIILNKYNIVNNSTYLMQ
jgi:hypothetical protein